MGAQEGPFLHIKKMRTSPSAGPGRFASSGSRKKESGGGSRVSELSVTSRLIVSTAMLASGAASLFAFLVLGTSAQSFLYVTISVAVCYWCCSVSVVLVETCAYSKDIAFMRCEWPIFFAFTEIPGAIYGVISSFGKANDKNDDKVNYDPQRCSISSGLCRSLKVRLINSKLRFIKRMMVKPDGTREREAGASLRNCSGSCRRKLVERLFGFPEEEVEEEEENEEEEKREKEQDKDERRARNGEMFAIDEANVSFSKALLGFLFSVSLFVILTATDFSVEILLYGCGKTKTLVEWFQSPPRTSER